MKTPIITIVGRPNVGKSTLFNKMVGKRIAITADESGTTRDRLFHKVEHPMMDFFLVDTGGLEFGKGATNIEDDMQTQARVAIDEGDLILFIVESQNGLQPQDYKVAELLRKKSQKPVFLVVNKCDEGLNDAELAEYYALGLGDPAQVSAMHKRGIAHLISQCLHRLKDRHFVSKDDEAYREYLRQGKAHVNIALVGKPNAGKSSLINAMLNKEKLIVSDTPGTTRDSTDSLVPYQGKFYNFVDTAGLRRPGKIETGIEHFSALRSMASIERCDISLLVLDASQPISHQDQAIASYIVEAGKGLIILANKWDIKPEEPEEKPVYTEADEPFEGMTIKPDREEIDEEEKERLRSKKANSQELKRRNIFVSRLRKKFPFLSWAPVVFTSAITKKNMHHIFEQVELIMPERRKRISTAKLNTFLEKLVNEHKPTGKGTTSARIYYITQPEIEPPHFLLFANKKKNFHFSYKRYVENRLREKFTFLGTPIRIEYREKEQRERGKK